MLRARNSEECWKMIEIIKQDGHYVARHDGGEFDEDGIVRHVEENGHKRENIAYVALGVGDYNERKRIAGRIDCTFDRKEKIAGRRRF